MRLPFPRPPIVTKKKSYARRTPTYFTRGSLATPSKNGRSPTSGAIATESNTITLTTWPFLGEEDLP